MCLKKGSSINASSTLLSLSPYLDPQGILRVSGRLHKMEKVYGIAQTHPIIIPKNHCIAVLLVHHFHELVEHQGRHMTEGAIHKVGFWITGARRTISSLIHHCVTCWCTRGQSTVQKWESFL